MRRWVVLFLLAGVLGLRCAGQQWYVAPGGDDRAAGDAAHPLATLREARDRLRALRTGRQLQDTVVIWLADGVYHLVSPLILEPRDGGTERWPVIYRALPGAKPVLCGGREYHGFGEDERGWWHLTLPPGIRTEQLFVNGRRMTRAREPDSGFFHMNSVTEQIWWRGKGRVPALARQIIGTDEQSLRQLRELSSSEVQEVRITVYHKWDITRRTLDGFTDTSLIVSGQGMKPWNRWHRGTRYRLENFWGALSRPEEWYLDQEGLLTFIPPPGMELNTATVVVPVTPRLLILRGRNGEKVRNIRFEGIRFLYTADPLAGRAFEPAQAANTIGAAIEVDEARGIAFDRCEIAHTGGYAVWFRDDCRGCSLTNSFLYDLGAGGVRIGTTDIPREERVTHDVHICNNIIRSGGYLYPPAVGVWIGHSASNEVCHNDIADFRYTGVSVGWVWGYGPSPAKGNLITYNRIHHLGWGLLSDMGGVYTLGLSEGTVVSHNVIHHIWAYDYGGWGLYTDEGSGGILMESNLVYATKTGGFHQHYGKENIIRNNVFQNADRYQLQCTRVEDHLSFTFTGNVVWYDRGVLLGGPWDRIRIRMDSCLYWHDGGEVRFLKMTLRQWQRRTGHDRHSRIADPGWEKDQNGDPVAVLFTPIKGTAFRGFDTRQAGVTGENPWHGQARLDLHLLEDFRRIMQGKKPGEEGFR